MTLEQAIFLFISGALGGALNSVAGGGSFISFPALLFVGVPPIPANATNAIALWLGAAGSGGAYRSRLNIPKRVMVPLISASLIGGLAGAVLLLRTPAHTFMQVLPWLTLGPTLLFVFGKKISGNRASMAHDATRSAIVGGAIFQFFVAIYGGYFGGGMGIVMLAMLAMLGMTDIHDMNALKSVMGFVINGVAVVAFVVAGAVYWRQGSMSILGAITGGYFGAHYAQKLPQRWVRGFVILSGATMTVYFFYKAYLS